MGLKRPSASSEERNSRIESSSARPQSLVSGIVYNLHNTERHPPPPRTPTSFRPHYHSPKKKSDKKKRPPIPAAEVPAGVFHTGRQRDPSRRISPLALLSYSPPARTALAPKSPACAVLTDQHVAPCRAPQEKARPTVPTHAALSRVGRRVLGRGVFCVPPPPHTIPFPTNLRDPARSQPLG